VGLTLSPVAQVGIFLEKKVSPQQVIYLGASNNINRSGRRMQGKSKEKERLQDLVAKRRRSGTQNPKTRKSVKIHYVLQDCINGLRNI